MLLATPESAMRLVDAAWAVTYARYDALEQAIAAAKRSKISKTSQPFIGNPRHSNLGFGNTPNPPRWKSAPGLTPTGKRRRRRIAPVSPSRTRGGQPGNTNRLRHGRYQKTKGC
jgi:hypothetical protein